jgi:hypothetical protein
VVELPPSGAHRRGPGASSRRWWGIVLLAIALAATSFAVPALMRSWPGSPPGGPTPGPSAGARP